jgi:hypothetical protein
VRPSWSIYQRGTEDWGTLAAPLSPKPEPPFLCFLLSLASKSLEAVMFSKLIPVVLIAAAMSYAQNSDDFSTAIASTIVATPATGVVGSFYTTTL